MCGLVGFITKDGKAPAVSARQIKRALIRCADRGTNATGIFWEEDKNYKIFKAPIPADRFIEHVPWETIEKSPFCMMHTRATTQGSEEVFTNNHPLIAKRYALAHNGVIGNSNDFVPPDVCDSLAIFEAIKITANNAEAELTFTLIEQALASLYGTIAWSLFDMQTHKLFLLSAGNPLVIAQKENTIFWASTAKIVTGLRPYMISEMLPDYLVCIDRNFMKGRPINVSKVKYGAYSVSNNCAGWYKYDSKSHTYHYRNKEKRGNSFIAKTDTKVASSLPPSLGYYGRMSGAKQTVVGNATQK